MDIGIDPVYAQRRQTLKGEVNKLVGLLQQNPRYPEGERTMLKEEMGLEGGIMDNPTAFRTRLLAIDDILALDLKDAVNIMQEDPSTTTKEARQWASKALTRIPSFRARLGIPIRVKTLDEAMKLPPGTQFINPAGEVRTLNANGGKNGE